jgi:hypothetical protein
MRKHVKWCVVLALAAASLVLPTAVLAGTTVPYKGTDTGTWAVGTEPCEGSFIITTSGVATHLGKYTYSSHECATGDVTYAGSFTLTAANGDTIVGSYEGTFKVDAAGNVFYEQTNTITGGSGRFADASGSFHLSGIGYFGTASGADIQRSQGEISTVG